ncbi:hypothetical protein CYQ88_01845 [Hydrogenovibrio sp. SC-1]|uniref:hypothetical protein n=1 Tax=Hydrogenovibrio sp. SC-1 TaxID=2065820 RepID=UPI000C7DED0A|nr:hypothetical protein [Hydrogenovibrio sp. SC-1]PLA75334.1 hypothetical protein CYQ88_01845 [Hydrogenovibrio sp. SC-1]
MVYIKRNAQNEIIDMQFSPKSGYEYCSLYDPDIKSFIEESQNEELIKKILKTMDIEMVRVIEDLVDILVDRRLILFTDLPEPVQNKLLFKRSIRENLAPESSMIDDDEVLNF